MKMKRNATAIEAPFPRHLSTICPDKEVEVSVQKMLQSGMDTLAVLEVAIETFHLKDCSLLEDLIIGIRRRRA